MPDEPMSEDQFRTTAQDLWGHPLPSIKDADKHEDDDDD